MYLFKLLMFLAFIYSVRGIKNIKSLTESMGQEVIEIGAPIKELPPGLEEEPSAEQEDTFDDDMTTTVTIPPATKKETKKIIKTTIKTNPESANQLNDDEEMKIEKELSEIYKDTDYKTDVTEALDGDTVDPEKDEKQILRQKAKPNFKFQPDMTNKVDIERFRTSVDEITCDKGVTQKLSSDSDEIRWDHSQEKRRKHNFKTSRLKKPYFRWRHPFASFAQPYFRGRNDPPHTTPPRKR